MVEIALKSSETLISTLSQEVSVATEKVATEEPEILANLRSEKLFDSNENNVADREFHTEEKSSYWLPKDEDEQHRLTGQHFAMKELLGGNVLPKVHELVDFKKGVSVLDVGCGSGIWMMDMASDYPNSIYEGCDIVDIVYKNVNMPQVSFSLGNVLKGLKYADNTFDFVMMRFLVLALREEEWPIAIKEILRVTKPGGVIHLLEADLKIPEGKVAPLLVIGAHNMCKSRGQNPRIALKLEDITNEVGGSKILASEYFSVNISEDTAVAKKFRWDSERSAATLIPLFGPMLGFDTDEKQKQFLLDLHEEYISKDIYFPVKAIVAQKI